MKVQCGYIECGIEFEPKGRQKAHIKLGNPVYHSLECRKKANRIRNREYYHKNLKKPKKELPAIQCGYRKCRKWFVPKRKDNRYCREITNGRTHSYLETLERDKENRRPKAYRRNKKLCHSCHSRPVAPGNYYLCYRCYSSGNDTDYEHSYCFSG